MAYSSVKKFLWQQNPIEAATPPQQQSSSMASWNGREFLSLKLNRVRKRLRGTWRCFFPTQTTEIKKLSGESRLSDRILVKAREELVNHLPAASPNHAHQVYGPKEILLLSNVYFWPHLGVAADQQGRLIKDTFLCDYRLSRLVGLDAFQSDDIQVTHQPSTAIECSWAWANHYHWLVDAIPRAWLLWHPELQKHPNINLYISDFQTNGMLDILRAVIPPNVTIRCVGRRTKILSTYYIHLPCLSENFCGYLPPEYIQFFQQSMRGLYQNGDVSISHRRIFISRRAATKRRILNEQELIGSLAPHGFVPVQLEGLTLEQQFQLFSQVEMIVAPHGAGLTNMLFSPCCRILELFGSDAFSHYRWLAFAAGHQYANITGNHSHKNDDFDTPSKQVLNTLLDCCWI